VRTRCLAITGLAIVAILGLATGCGGSGDSGGTGSSPAAAADPKQALVNSVNGLREGNFTFTIADQNSTGSASIHAPSKSAEINMTLKMDTSTEGTFAVVIIDQERWMKLDFGPQVNAMLKLPKGWMHIDPAKITDSELMKELSVNFGTDDTDPLDSGTIFKALVTAEQTGAGAYSGTVDLTQAKDAGMLDEDVLTALGDKAKAIPFTATLDGQGRLTKLSLDMPAAGEWAAHKVEVAYADYGSATAAKKPPADQVKEAPAAAYELLNS
jgi:hypothetical protein